VLQALGNSIREKRSRLKSRFTTYSNQRDVNCLRDCTVESLNKIHQSVNDPNKKTVADTRGKPTLNKRV